jgi:hypothetical protein
VDYLTALSVSQTIQSVTERCAQILSTNSVYQNKKKCHINMFPEKIVSYSWKRALIIYAQNVLVGDCLVGPHIWPQQLTDNHYLDFLLHDLQKLLEGAPLAVRARTWCLHDGSPTHCSRAVRDVLSSTYHDRWIGRGGPTAWPPRSPLLNL